MPELRKLFAHQTNALKFAEDKNSVGFLMEMRLGKTLAVIRQVKELRMLRQATLIIAPLSVLPVWERELKEEGFGERDITVVGTGSDLVGICHGWVLTNYEYVRSHPEIFRFAWNVIVLDESSKIRNPKAQVTRTIVKQSSDIPYRFILSGTPAPESPLDYFEQMNFLHGGAGWLNCKNFWEFRHRFFHNTWNQWDWAPNKGTLQLIHNELRKDCFVLTREEARMDTKKIYELRYVQPTPGQLRQYKLVEKEFRFESLDKGEFRDFLTNSALTQLVWLCRIAGGFGADSKLMSDAKTKELISLLEGELADQKVVVWFRFNTEIHHVARALTKAKISHALITGKTHKRERELTTHMFQSEISKTPRVLLVQVKCGKFGVNWSAASSAIYYSNGFSLEDRLQSEDRILHPTKKSPLLFIDLITKNTIDEDIVNVLRAKKFNSRLFMKKLLEQWALRRKQSDDKKCWKKK